jgi:excinuclease ABC subunit B
MQKAMDETARRRVIQLQYNADHGITPQTVQKAIRASLESEVKARKTAQDAIHANDSQFDQTEIVRLLEEEMLQAAQNLEFERAAQLRDKITEIKGTPTIDSKNAYGDVDAETKQKIWQPKNPARPKRRVAK